MLHTTTDLIAENLRHKKKDLGIFFTPYFVIDLMLSLIKHEILAKHNLEILEPACGIAQFLRAFSENYPAQNKEARKTGVDINPDFVHLIRNHDKCKDIECIEADYLLWDSKKKFDIILGNPPYGIPSNTQHYSLKVENYTKTEYKKKFETWRGKYNLYGAFIEKAIQQLKTGGQLLFVLPSSFLLLDDFIKLRQFLSINGETEIIYLGNDVFRPDAVVSTVILNFVKKGFGILNLLEYINFKNIEIKLNTNWKGEIITFQTAESLFVEHHCPQRFGTFFNTNVSPRTPEVKNNESILKSEVIYQDAHIPILGSQNLKRGYVSYEPISGYWLRKDEVEKYRGYYKIPHIAVALGLRGVGCIAAAYDELSYPWMGDVYHLLPLKRRLSNTEILDDKDLVEWLNSETLGQYIKDVFRDITYHLNITQISHLPVPLKETWHILKAKESPRQGILDF